VRAHVRQRQLAARTSAAPSSSEANGVRVVRHVLKVGEARGVHDRPALLAVEGVAIGAILAAGEKVEGGIKSSGHWLITNQESAQFSAQRGDKKEGKSRTRAASCHLGVQSREEQMGSVSARQTIARRRVTERERLLHERLSNCHYPRNRALSISRT
jgi:hypothetical protein